MRRIINSVIGLLTLLYPLAVYFGIQYVEPWKIAAALSSLLVVRLMTSSGDKKWSRWLIVVGVIYCAFAVWNNNLITLRFYPALISLALFIIFASSLFFPPPIIERLARIQHPDLPQQGVIYTRKVTQVWCVFFVINGLIAAATAVWSSFAWWSLYNGLISYLLVAVLMGVEYLVRVRTQEHVR